MDGSINVRSSVGQGTTFSFDAVLPTCAGLPTQVHARRVRGIELAGRAIRVLVADDKEENRLLVREWMSMLGIEVREAANGQEAIEQWEAWEPHLIWMDMRMPVLDGYEATRRIKSTTKRQATVIIALTASAFEHERSIVLSAGCDDFVRKPAMESTVYEKLAKHLGLKLIYDDEPVTEQALAKLTPGMLAEMPADWRECLAAAAESVDVQAAEQAVALIRDAHPQLARALDELISTFRFDQIQDALAGVHAA